MKMMPPDDISHENQLQHLSEPSIFMLDVFRTADHADSFSYHTGLRANSDTWVVLILALKINVLKEITFNLTTTVGPRADETHFKKPKFFLFFFKNLKNLKS